MLPPVMRAALFGAVFVLLAATGCRFAATVSVQLDGTATAAGVVETTDEQFPNESRSTLPPELEATP